MAFSDLAKSALDFAVGTGAPESEAIEYRSVDGLGKDQAPWKSIRAQVDREPEARGFSTDVGRSAVVVCVSKTDVAAVNEQRDCVRLEGGTKTYTVARVLSEDSGGFELFCE